MDSTINEKKISLNEYTAKYLESLSQVTINDIASMEERKFLKKMIEDHILINKKGEIQIYDYDKILPNICLEVNESCNYNCTHCCIGQKSQQNLDDLVFNIVDQALELGTYSVDLTGGEPTLNSRFKDYVRYMRDKNIRVSLTSNGSIINNSLAEFLGKEKVSRVTLTFCGEKEAHDSIYGNGAFKRNLQAVANLKHNKVPYSFNILINDNNMNSVTSESFAKLINDLNPIDTTISPILPIGNAIKNRSYLSPNNYSQFYTPHITNEKDLNCVAQKKTLFIKANGEVNPCHNFPTINLGNIREESLQSIWNKESEISRFSQLNDNCTQCSKFKICGGGCRGIMAQIGTNIYSGNPYLCNALSV